MNSTLKSSIFFSIFFALHILSYKHPQLALSIFLTAYTLSVIGGLVEEKKHRDN